MNIESAIQTLRSKEQACVELGISNMTLQRKIKSGEITPLKIGQTVRFSQEAIDTYLKKKSATVKN